MRKRIVFIIGAGATFADGRASAETAKPPLDSRFFSLAQKKHPRDTGIIANYMKRTFHIDVFHEKYNRLEAVMAMLYTDIFHPAAGKISFVFFRNLIKLYNRRIAETTNRLEPNKQSLLFRVIASVLPSINKLSDITFITFNHDLHIERTLEKFETYAHYKRKGRFLSFPRCYGLESAYITSQRSNPEGQFKITDEDVPAPRIYKLHGSLNWYSRHARPDIPRTQFFDVKRKINITTRKKLSVEMRYSEEGRRPFTFPIIIPPILHKAGILHKQLKTCWTQAETALERATDVIIFGYSCPEIDLDSCNMIHRQLSGRDNLENLSVIDPNPDMARRYIELLNAHRLIYYRDVKSFLAQCS